MKHFLTILLAVAACMTVPAKAGKPLAYSDYASPAPAITIRTHSTRRPSDMDDWGIGEWMPIVLPRHFTFTINMEAVQRAGWVFEDSWKGRAPSLIPAGTFGERAGLLEYILTIDPGALIYPRGAWAAGG